MTTRRVFATLVVLLAVATRPALVRTETINCTHITTVPAVISTPGVYCLVGSLTTAMTSGSAIDIQANNVVLDLNGFRVAGLAAGPGTQAIGIYAGNRQNITIKNGIVRGFLGGVALEGGTGHLIEGINADQNTDVGIYLAAIRSIIRNNQITTTGGTTVEVGPGTGVGGILVKNGAGVRVLDNDIAYVVRGASEVSAGIAFDGGSNNFAVNNRISAVTDYGIVFIGGGTGKYRDNLTASCPTPYSGGTDVGNNQ